MQAPGGAFRITGREGFIPPFSRSQSAALQVPHFNDLARALFLGKAGPGLSRGNPLEQLLLPSSHAEVLDLCSTMFLLGEKPLVFMLLLSLFFLLLILYQNHL